MTKGILQAAFLNSTHLIWQDGLCRSGGSTAGTLDKNRTTGTMSTLKVIQTAAAVESGVAALACSAETD